MKLTTAPKCPEHFRLNKDSCRCTISEARLEKLMGRKKTAKRKKSTKPRKAAKRRDRLPKVKIAPDGASGRCPRGMFYNKAYQMCELNVLRPQKTKKNRKALAKPKKRRINIGAALAPDSVSIRLDSPKKRAKPRTNRSKTARPKTARPKTTKSKKSKPRTNRSKTRKVQIIDNKTPRMDRILGKFYQKQAVETGSAKPVTAKKALKNLDKIVSFSPEINQQLVQMKSVARNTFDDCETFGTNSPRIRVKDGQCLPFDSAGAQEFLLANLSSKAKIDCSRVIAPKQVASNCWFNTMFMSFFVSDKGRKFFRFFRQLMIQGVNSKGVPLAKNLRIAFFQLNMAVEAVLGSQAGNDDAVARKMALNMNTNVIIQKIYSAIPPAYRQGIYRKNQAGNPLTYYEAIIRYLGGDSVRMLTVDRGAGERWGRNWEDALRAAMAAGPDDGLPDVIVFEFHDEEGDPRRTFEPVRRSNKPTKFTTASGGQEADYVLDSCIIRDTEKDHFASLLTCNKRQFGFDGISFGRLNPFAWKGLINTSKRWKFAGSDTDWNFRDGYQLLFYYRS